eukprot:TRINITY_DN3524_c0_g1_i2.p1 TRINITY_DN3524_c0_g1~~TRINITY_DN3524_c0_g1_i2.p1  ORF type:complete len:314 (-),score=55.65 TRINITY_DN3524_c0_g1_i2:879-1820(-)
MDLSVKRIGKYQLGTLLGKGNFGVVYQGLDLENGEFVAIKQIQLNKIPKDQINSIMSEINLLKKLNHKHIVKYIGYAKSDEFLNIILEYVENGSLLNIVKKFGAFPEHLVRIYVSQVLEGLIYLHEQGVIHRDIKGANILTTKEGQVKLADFGVAKKLNEEGDLHCGTPYWMAPEVISLEQSTLKSDIWSVGCTVIELLTGSPPYFNIPPMNALYRIVNDDCPPIPERITPALEDFLLKCFQKQANLRVSAEKLLKHPWIRRLEKEKKLEEETLDIIYNDNLKSKGIGRLFKNKVRKLRQQSTITWTPENTKK